MCTCGVLTHDIQIIGYSGGEIYRECLRPEGHSGPHLIRRENGVFVAYETDWSCECSSCQSGDPFDWCEIYFEVSPQKAMIFIREKEEQGS